MVRLLPGEYGASTGLARGLDGRLAPWAKAQVRAPTDEHKAPKNALFMCWLCRRKFENFDKFDYHVLFSRTRLGVGYVWGPAHGKFCGRLLRGVGKGASSTGVGLTELWAGRSRGGIDPEG